jgi:hypothetical protein
MDEGFYTDGNGKRFLHVHMTPEGHRILEKITAATEFKRYRIEDGEYIANGLRGFTSAQHPAPPGFIPYREDMRNVAIDVALILVKRTPYTGPRKERR